MPTEKILEQIHYFNIHADIDSVENMHAGKVLLEDEVYSRLPRAGVITNSLPKRY